MARKSILIVEDEEDIQELVRYNLAKEGFEPTGVVSGEEAIVKARAALPDLILLDLMLPGVDGLEVCRQLKKDPKTSPIPIIMLTAKGEDADIVSGLELGADDYVTKPFSPRVLVSRIRAVLRRADSTPMDEHTSVRAHEMQVDPDRHQVTVNEQPVDLTATEFAILLFLVRQPGWVFSRNQIINAVKGQSYAVTERSVDVQIVGLRKKLGAAGRYIETVRGVGYRFKE
jgi:phosphate regulon transcriptional regulator PhoB